jgi:hypothetical protein
MAKKNRNKNIPNPNSPDVFIGQPVKVPDLGIIGEVYELSVDVKNLITKVKVYASDGKIDIFEVSSLVVIALEITTRVVRYKFWNWLVNLFKKKNKKNNGKEEDKQI